MKRKYWSLGALWLYSTILLSAQEVRVHTIGDSTMADYVENTTRTRGWGEMFQEFFYPEVEVINYAGEDAVHVHSIRKEDGRR